MKARRQSVILDVIQREPVRSQEQLRQRVRAAGFDVTQATLSRDIRELGLVKGGADGAYQAAAPAAPNGQTARSLLQRALGEYLTRVDRVQQMVLLRTGPGQAQLLGVALDRARLRRWSAPLPATTRFSSSRPMCAARGRSSSGSEKPR